MFREFSSCLAVDKPIMHSRKTEISIASLFNIAKLQGDTSQSDVFLPYGYQYETDKLVLTVEGF